jgi:outer membrane protein assembly factor BamB
MRKRAVLAVVAAALGIALVADAQRIDPRKPTTIVVGAPRGGMPMQRVDAHRSGLSKTPLPAGPLKVEWKKATGLTLDQPALLGADGLLAVISGRGDVMYLEPEKGDEKATVRVGASQIGTATMSSDGTIVFVTSSGDAMGVRRGSAGQQTRFTTRIGGERNPKAAPLSLDDGGVVVATLADLVVLDSDGNVRARATLPEQIAAPLLASGDKILAISTTGTVFGWTPGREAVRVGSFGAPVDNGAALTPSGTLVAVIENNHLAEVDIAHGTRQTWSIAPQGLYLGPPAIRSMQGGAGIATIGALTNQRGFVLAIDASGQELLRAPVAAFNPQPLPDGGLPPLQAPPHVGSLVDSRGGIAFASSTDGRVGTIAPDGALDTISDAFCTKTNIRSGIVGLTPFGPNAFAVTCDGGLVVKVVGASNTAVPAPPPRASGSAAREPGEPGKTEKLRTRP